jgi:hypothetical protein
MTRRGTTLCGAVAALALAAGADRASAMEPGNFGQTLAGATIGAVIAAPAPPGVYIVMDSFIGPQGTGTGQNLGTTVTVPLWAPTIYWSTGWQFLGANVAGAVVQPFYYVASYQSNGGTLGGNGSGPPFGGPGANPFVGGTLWFENSGNTLFTPLILQWTLGHGWFADLGVTLIAPDGSHYNGTNNPDYFTVEPRGGLAYIDKDWHFTANFKYDINESSKGHTGPYQIIANAPPVSFVPPLAATIASFGNGYTSGNELFADLALTHLFGKLEIGPVASVKVQTTTDTPGSGFTCAQVAAALGPGLSCGRAENVAVGGLVGYNFGPVDWQVWVEDSVYTRDDFAGWGIFTRLTYKLWGPDAAPPSKPMYTK